MARTRPRARIRSVSTSTWSAVTPRSTSPLPARQHAAPAQPSEYLLQVQGEAEGQVHDAYSRSKFRGY